MISISPVPWIGKLWNQTLESLPEKRHAVGMSTVQILESELLKLSTAEMRQIRDWLDDLLEDQLKFTDEFEAEIQQSEREMAAGRHSRTRPPMARE